MGISILMCIITMCIKSVLMYFNLLGIAGVKIGLLCLAFWLANCGAG